MLALETNHFPKFLLKYRKELPITNLLTKKTRESRHFVDNSGRSSDITTT